MTKKQPSVLLKMFPLFLVLFIDSMGLGLLFPILTSIIIDPVTHFLPTSFSNSSREIIYGLVVGIFMLSWFFGAAILGDLSDMIGRRKSLAICLVGTCFGYLLAAVAVVVGSLTLLIVGRIIAGFTSGSQPIAQAAIIDQSNDDTKAKNMSLIILFITLGFVAGPLLGGVLSDKAISPLFGFYTPLYFAAIISLVNIALLFWLFKETTIKTKKLNIRLHHAISVFISAFTHKKIRFLSLCSLIMLIGWSAFFTYIPVYVNQIYHFSGFMVAMFSGALGLGFALGAGIVVNIVNRYWSLKTTVTGGFILCSLSILLMLLFPSQIVAWIAAIITGACICTAWPNLMVMFSNQVNDDEQGWVMGVTGSIMALAFAVVSFLMGFLVQFGMRLPLITAAVCIFAAGLLISRLKSNNNND